MLSRLLQPRPHGARAREQRVWPLSLLEALGAALPRAQLGRRNFVVAHGLQRGANVRQRRGGRRPAPSHAMRGLEWVGGASGARARMHSATLHPPSPASCLSHPNRRLVVEARGALRVQQARGRGAGGRCALLSAGAAHRTRQVPRQEGCQPLARRLHSCLASHSPACQAAGEACNRWACRDLRGGGAGALPAAAAPRRAPRRAPQAAGRSPPAARMFRSPAAATGVGRRAAACGQEREAPHLGGAHVGRPSAAAGTPASPHPSGRRGWGAAPRAAAKSSPSSATAPSRRPEAAIWGVDAWKSTENLEQELLAGSTS